MSAEIVTLSPLPIVIVSLSLVLVVTYFLILCLCKDRSNANSGGAEILSCKPTSESDSAIANNGSLPHGGGEKTEVESNGCKRVSNGISVKQENNKIKVNDRQLPDLPPTRSNKPAQEKVDMYDHLNMTQSSNNPVSPGYDRCIDDNTSASRNNSTKACVGQRHNTENIYNIPSGESEDSGSGVVSKEAIREPIYEVVTGEDSGSGVTRVVRENVYNEPDVIEVPRVSFHDEVSPNLKQEVNAADDDYSTVTDVDYRSGESNPLSSAANVGQTRKGKHDPYSEITIDRTSFVEKEKRQSANNDDAEGDERRWRVRTWPSGYGASLQGETSLKWQRPHSSVYNDTSTSSTTPTTSAAMYATVQKSHNSHKSDSAASTPTGPPVPGRLYTTEEVADSVAIDRQPHLPDASSMAMSSNRDPDRETAGCEVTYNQVTARESLASVQARQLQLNLAARSRRLNNEHSTYETVIDNLYSMVDGGPIIRVGDRPMGSSLIHRNSDISETYAEINTSGGSAIGIEPLPYDEVVGMVKPSTTDSTIIADPSERVSSDLYSAVKRNSRTYIHYNQLDKDETFPPIDKIYNHATLTKVAPLASAENDEIAGAAYKSLSFTDFDPNYESLDEIGKNFVSRGKDTKKKSTSNHSHQYEEVPVTGTSETASEIRTRVLRHHIYETLPSDPPVSTI